MLLFMMFGSVRFAIMVMWRRSSLRLGYFWHCWISD
jgi:hypothetical protein